VRWMKRLLLAIYLYMGIFFGICLLLWIITGREPETLIMGISAAVGVESVAAGAIRIYENKQQYKHEKEIQHERKEHHEPLETETDEP